RSPSMFSLSTKIGDDERAQRVGPRSLLHNKRLLDGVSAITHSSAIDLLREVAPHSTVCPKKQFVDNGRVMTSAGGSVGIELSLHAVGKPLGKDAAAVTARRMECKHWKGPRYWLNE